MLACSPPSTTARCPTPPRVDRQQPPRRAALPTGRAVDGFAQQVGMPVVAGVLLDHVAQDPAQAGAPCVRPGPRRRLLEPTGIGRLGQARSASRSTVSRGGLGSCAWSERPNHQSPTNARCSSNPPSVVVDAPNVAVSPAASSPAHLQTSVVRWYSRNPTRWRSRHRRQEVQGDLAHLSWSSPHPSETGGAGSEGPAGRPGLPMTCG